MKIYKRNDDQAAPGLNSQKGKSNKKLSVPSSLIMRLGLLATDFCKFSALPNFFQLMDPF